MPDSKRPVFMRDDLPDRFVEDGVGWVADNRMIARHGQHWRDDHDSRVRLYFQRGVRNRRLYVARADAAAVLRAIPRELPPGFVRAEVAHGMGFPPDFLARHAEPCRDRGRPTKEKGWTTPVPHPTLGRLIATVYPSLRLRGRDNRRQKRRRVAGYSLADLQACQRF